MKWKTNSPSKKLSRTACLPVSVISSIKSPLLQADFSAVGVDEHQILALIGSLLLL